MAAPVSNVEALTLSWFVFQERFTNIVTWIGIVELTVASMWNASLDRTLLAYVKGRFKWSSLDLDNLQSAATRTAQDSRIAPNDERSGGMFVALGKAHV